MAVMKFDLFVDGEHGPSSTGDRLESTNPANGRVIGSVERGHRGLLEKTLYKNIIMDMRGLAELRPGKHPSG